MNWFKHSLLYPFRHSINWSYPIFSSILDTVHNTEMSLYLFTSDFGPVSKLGVALVTFQTWGEMSFSNEALYISDNFFETKCTTSSSILTGILSAPGDLDLFRALIQSGKRLKLLRII